MEKTVQSVRTVRFANFELDLDAGELRKSGLKLKFSGQPFEVLSILLEQPGAIVTREQLQKRLWPDSFVDFDHNLNSAINRIREVLGDSAETPRFVETLPRKGYRFIAPVEGRFLAGPIKEISIQPEQKSSPRIWLLRALVLPVVIAILAGAGLIYKRSKIATPAQRALTRLTFDDGLQTDATWSPDGRFIAYTSNRGGKLDIWTQQVSGGNPVQLTQGPANNSQPDWSPDGKFIAYRSEADAGGIYIIPALGGAGLERRIVPFGYHPRWSPDSSRILFDTHFTATFITTDKFYVVDLDGGTPREIGAELPSASTADVQRHALSAAWNPDGKRISIWMGNAALAPSLWIVPIAGGAAAQMRIAPEMERQLEEISLAGKLEGSFNFKFCWAPSGRAIYFQRLFRGIANVWRMSVDPETSTGISMERLTTGPGDDMHPSLSSDGKRLAFTSQSIHIRSWLFPFDAVRGRITGTGHPVTPAGMNAWRNAMSRDGKMLAFLGSAGGKSQLWQKSLSDGRESPIGFADSYIRNIPQFSTDGSELAYLRARIFNREKQLMIWSINGGNEEPITTSGSIATLLPYDWSADDKSLLISQMNADTGRDEIWQLPLAARPHAETAARKILSDPAYDFFNAKFSPNGRWIVVNALRNLNNSMESYLYVISASGDLRSRISEGPWDDKPRWSPDGKTIYFMSLRGGRFNVWGIRFDPADGKRVGEPFSVTSFDDSSPTFAPEFFEGGDLAISKDKLVLTMEDRSGNVWMLDNVDR